MFYFVVVPIINDKTWRWGVRATRAMSYETRPPMIAKFRQKGHAEEFMRLRNLALIAPNTERTAA